MTHRGRPDGRVALITGAASGIVRATAERFLAEETQVVARTRASDDADYITGEALVVDGGFMVQ